MRRLSLSVLLSLSFATPVLSSSVSWDGNVSRLTCEQFGESLEFTLDRGQKVPRSELKNLCSCIASETNQSGWEVPALRKLAQGDDPGLINKQGATYRFGQAVKYCSRGKFYQTTATSKTSPSGRLSLNNQRILGFVFGGPIGIFIWPMIYQFFAGNLVVSIIVGVFAGGFSWSLSIYLPFIIVGLISSFIRGK